MKSVNLKKTIEVQYPARVSNGKGGFTVAYKTKYSDISASIKKQAKKTPDSIGT